MNDRNCITVDETVAPNPGTYKLCIAGPATQLVFRRGPVGKRRGRPAASSPATSTLSDSKRSSTNQTKFRWDLVARDSNCLITDEPYWDCTASHIVPYSRPDLYTDLLGYSGEWQFHPWMGVLLEDKMSHSFDRYEVSIWPRHLLGLVQHAEDHRDSVVIQKEWVIHVFHDRSGRLRQYHGKVFSVDRFRLPPVTWPREQFLAWHHQQCVMMHYRGFSYAIDADRP